MRAAGIAFFLSWVPERAGDVLMRRIAFAAIPPLSITLLLFLLVVFNTRRVAQELAESQARTESLAGRDPLSGLANRLLFGQTLDAALNALPSSPGEGKERGFSLMFLDLDRFKDVNDAHGHQAGDELIKQVAGRLLTILRVKDTLARFGGDEFAILQTDVSSDEDARSLAGQDPAYAVGAIRTLRQYRECGGIHRHCHRPARCGRPRNPDAHGRYGAL